MGANRSVVKRQRVITLFAIATAVKNFFSADDTAPPIVE